MDPADEFRTLRHRLDGLAARIDRAGSAQARGVPRYVGQVYSGGSIPTAVPRVYLTHPVTLGATEGEGQSVGFTADSSRSVPVLVIGPGVPVAGDVVIARQTQGRWVAPFPGATVTTPFAVACSGTSYSAFFNHNMTLTFKYLNTSSVLITTTITLSYDNSFQNWYTFSTLTLAGYPGGYTNHFFRFSCRSGTSALEHNALVFGTDNRTMIYTKVTAFSSSSSPLALSATFDIASGTTDPFPNSWQSPNPDQSAVVTYP